MGPSWFEIGCGKERGEEGKRGRAKTTTIGLSVRPPSLSGGLAGLARSKSVSRKKGVQGRIEQCVQLLLAKQVNLLFPDRARDCAKRVSDMRGPS